MQIRHSILYALIVLMNKEYEPLLFSFICFTEVARDGKVFLASLPTQLISSQQANPHAKFIESVGKRELLGLQQSQLSS